MWHRGPLTHLSLRLRVTLICGDNLLTARSGVLSTRVQVVPRTVHPELDLQVHDGEPLQAPMGRWVSCWSSSVIVATHGCCMWWLRPSRRNNLHENSSSAQHTCVLAWQFLHPLLSDGLCTYTLCLPSCCCRLPLCLCSVAQWHSADGDLLRLLLLLHQGMEKQREAGAASLSTVAAIQAEKGAEAYWL